MSYESKRFKEGLAGKEPGTIYIDQEGHDAQEAGYREYLSNRDLAERLFPKVAYRENCPLRIENDKSACVEESLIQLLAIEFRTALASGRADDKSDDRRRRLYPTPFGAQ